MTLRENAHKVFERGGEPWHMATGVEIGLLALAFVALAAVYLTMKVVKPLAYNAIVGLVVLVPEAAVVVVF